MPVPQPTTSEWIAAALAAGFVTVLAGLLLVRTALAGSRPFARVAGFLLAVQAAAVLLVAVVLCGAGIRAAQLGDPPLSPPGPYPALLISIDPSITEDVARFGAALLVPLAAALAALAVAVLGSGRSSYLRLFAGGVSGLVLGTCALAVLGEAGSLATGVALAIGALSLGVVAGLLADEMLAP